MPQVIASMKALIQKDNKFLFVYDPVHKETWDLPGGKIEYGEEPENALAREVKEETGLDVEIQKPVGVWYFYSKNHHHQVVCFTFLCETTSNQEVNLNSSSEVGEQITKFQWLTLQEALSETKKLPDSLLQLLRHSLPKLKIGVET